MTSSVAAVQSPLGKPDSHVYTEADWNEWSSISTDAYGFAKTSAEREAWASLKATPAPFDASVICPSVTLGPPLTKAHTKASTVLVRELLYNNTMNNYVTSFVDVRDVAAAAVAAHPQVAALMQHPHIVTFRAHPHAGPVVVALLCATVALVTLRACCGRGRRSRKAKGGAGGKPGGGAEPKEARAQAGSGKHKAQKKGRQQSGAQGVRLRSVPTGQLREEAPGPSAATLLFAPFLAVGRARRGRSASSASAATSFSASSSSSGRRRCCCIALSFVQKCGSSSGSSFASPPSGELGWKDAREKRPCVLCLFGVVAVPYTATSSAAQPRIWSMSAS